MTKYLVGAEMAPYPCTGMTLTVADGWDDFHDLMAVPPAQWIKAELPELAGYEYAVRHGLLPIDIYTYSSDGEEQDWEATGNGLRAIVPGETEEESDA